MRMANGDNGFSSEELETLEREVSSGYHFPSESYFEESWHEFCLGTLNYVRTLRRKSRCTLLLVML
jgi:hypothetical protein